MNSFEELNNKKILLSSWLQDHAERSAQMPYVQQSLDMVNHQIKVASNMPTNIPSGIKQEIVTAFSGVAPFWGSFVEAFPIQTNNVLAVSGLALETTSSNIAYQAITSIEVGGSVEIDKWVSQSTQGYQEIQSLHNRAGAVRDRLSEMVPHRVVEFDESERQFMAVLAQTQPQSAWGIHARNVLEHLKGDLFAATQRLLGKQKVKWPDFAGTLACGETGAPEHTGLLREEETAKTLQVVLSDIAKNRIQLLEQDLRHRHSEFLDHLFSVLTLVDLNKFRSL